MPGATLSPPPAPHALSRAAWGTRVQFFVSGALFATWGVHVPTVKAHYALGEAALAVAMLAAGVGAVFALLLAGRVVGRHGPRAVTFVMGLVCCACVGGLLAFDRLGALLALMLVYGAANSLMDVSFNAEASEIEHLAGRPLMSGFHGMYSLGGMAGAAAGSALQAAAVAPAHHLLAAALVGAVAIAAGCVFMLRMASAPSASPLSLPTGPLLLLGALAAIGLIAEGAMYDWSVLYMKQGLATDGETAALAYASFSGAMAAARFGGDAVRARMSAVRLMRLSGALGALGMALVLLAPAPWSALAGFALVGLGFANVVPVLFSAAARVPGVTAAHGIAAVSAMGYLGMMAGPPLIGVIAEARSLAAGLSVVVVFAAIVALAARRAL